MPALYGLAGGVVVVAVLSRLFSSAPPSGDVVVDLVLPWAFILMAIGLIVARVLVGSEKDLRLLEALAGVVIPVVLLVTAVNQGGGDQAAWFVLFSVLAAGVLWIVHGTPRALWELIEAGARYPSPPNWI